MDLLIALAVGVGWIVDKAAEGVIGGAAETKFAATLRDLRDRVPALAGTPAGDDLARGLRRVQLRALERVILDYREVGHHGWLTELAARPNPFFEQALAFCRSARDLPLRWDGRGARDGGLHALVPAEDGPATMTAGAALVRDATLDELSAALDGTTMPDGFVDHFRDGSRERHGFLELFSAYFAEQVRDDAAFREILHTRLLLQTAAGVAGVGSTLVRVEERLESGFDEQREALAALAKMVAADKGVPLPAIRAILERMGEAGVADEQVQSRLEAKADEYLSLREQWSKLGETTPDVEAVRREALALVDVGDLDGARQRFTDARAALKAVRERRAREEAALLADEAEIDLLQFRYLAAADRYAEAEALVLLFDADARFDLLCKRADVVQRHGDEFGDNHALAEAIELWLQAAQLRPRIEAPHAWAMAQNNLGNALSRLGGRESGTARLEEAVDAYRAALEEYTRDRSPLSWATIQNNLGAALHALGERESGTARLEEAVEAYRAALEERTRSRVPLSWAMTQNNLGGTLSLLGERESGTASLVEAVDAYRAALEEYTRDRVPLDWAMTQSNLASALRKLGERESGTVRLAEAVEAYRAALEERTRDRVPLDWAMTQNNLGNALQALGDRESGTARLEEAVEAYRAALEERTRDRVPLSWAMTENNLGNALGTLGTRESGTARLEEAVDAYRAALEEYTRDRVPLLWAMTQNNLGSALRMLGERESGTARLEEAIEAYHAALEERTRERVPLDWAMTQNNMGNALQTLAEGESGTARLEAAIEAYQRALDVFEAAETEYYIAAACRGLARARALLDERIRGAE